MLISVYIQRTKCFYCVVLYCVILRSMSTASIPWRKFFFVFKYVFTGYGSSSYIKVIG